MAATRVNVPTWTGKALGAAAALVFAPPHPVSVLWWLAAGILLGHGFDSLGTRVSRDALGDPRNARHDSRASLRFTFAALGRIAAAAGTGEPVHLDYAERLMARLAFTPERRQEALAWFHAGADPAFPFDALAGPCRAAFAAHPVLQDLARQSWCRMAAVADTPDATRALLALAEQLGWDRGALAIQAVAITAYLVDQDAAARARDALGAGPADGPDAIRLAYRRRVARWHPDRLPPDSSAQERAVAEQYMCRLREALELLVGRNG